MADEYREFYLAGALIVGAYSRGEYLLWLLDYSNDDKFADWEDGDPVPVRECVLVNRAWTQSSPGPNGQVHFADDEVLVQKLKMSEESLLPLELVDGFRMPAVVALASELWGRVPVEDRPLPRDHRDQDYRIKLITRAQDGAHFMGFHAKRLAGDPSNGGLKVQLYDWNDEPLGTGDWLDMSTDMEPTVSTIKSDSLPYTTGSVFVSAEYVAGKAYLAGPKVPWRGQTAFMRVKRAAMRVA